MEAPGGSDEPFACQAAALAANAGLLQPAMAHEMLGPIRCASFRHKGRGVVAQVTHDSLRESGNKSG